MPSDRPIEISAADMPGSKKLFVKTYGCQMNVYDSERMGDALRPLGYQVVETPQDADVVVVNTCHIREKAAEKLYSALGRLRELKAERATQGKRMQIAVAGCVAQAEGAEIARRESAVDLVVGPQSYHRLPELLFRSRAEARTIIDTNFPAVSKFNALPDRKSAGQSAAAFLTVQEGCDKFCTFCVVPYTRGAELSRPVAQIVDELRRLCEAGVREVTLLGQNVNGYHGPGPEGEPWSLARLIARLTEVPGIARIRYMTSHPRDMRPDLVEEHRRNPKLMPFLHLPIQSGSDRVLAAMNRKHTIKDYLSLIEDIRDARPDIALSTDIIVGFPGETEEDFRGSLEVVRRVGFAQAFSFKYSPRPGTPAALLDGQISEDVKSERLARLQELLTSQQIAFNESCIGKTMPVLFERPGRRPGQIIGRSPYLQAVHVEAEANRIGQIAPVAINSATLSSLGGVIVAE